MGRLLYAFLGYEATPSLAQFMGYTSGILMIAGVYRSVFFSTPSPLDSVGGRHDKTTY